jgi:hypothetical protein
VSAVTPPSVPPVQVASSGTPGNRHAHLDPLVEAEVRWGNEVAEDWHAAGPHPTWTLRLARPFHVDRVRADFRFPSDVGLYVAGARRRRDVPAMCLGDILGVARVCAPLPAGWPAEEAAVPLAPEDPADSRKPIATMGLPDRPEVHLDPVVRAELAWGNRVQSAWGRLDKLLDDRSLTLARPLHVEELRRSFRFPANVRLYAALPRPERQGGAPGLQLSDVDRFVTIRSPLPGDWPYGEGEVEL